MHATRERSSPKLWRGTISQQKCPSSACKGTHSLHTPSPMPLGYWQRTEGIFPFHLQNKKSLKIKNQHTPRACSFPWTSVLREDNVHFCVCHHPMHVQSTHGFAGPPRRCQIIGFNQYLCKKITLQTPVHTTQEPPPYAPAADSGRLHWNLIPLLARKSLLSFTGSVYFLTCAHPVALVQALSSGFN